MDQASLQQQRKPYVGVYHTMHSPACMELCQASNASTLPAQSLIQQRSQGPANITKNTLLSQCGCGCVIARHRADRCRPQQLACRMAYGTAAVVGWEGCQHKQRRLHFPACPQLTDAMCDVYRQYACIQADAAAGSTAAARHLLRNQPTAHCQCHNLLEGRVSFIAHLNKKVLAACTQ